MHPSQMQSDRPRWVQIYYTNYRGEQKIYRIIPHTMFFGHTQYHLDDQWLLDATDVDRNTVRTFAVKDVHSWRPCGTDLPLQL